MQIVELDQANLSMIPDFLSTGWPRVYDRLLKETPWQQDVIKLYGREILIPRLQAWYGDKHCQYSYSGIQLSPHPWTPLLQDLKEQVESACKAKFNSVLLNLYRDGQDSNGWHSDDEPELGEQPVIASLSLGATRRFRLRHRQQKATPPISLDLEGGSLLVMAGETQKYWQHCITKTRKPVGPRINLTFRKIMTSP